MLCYEKARVNPKEAAEQKRRNKVVLRSERHCLGLIDVLFPLRAGVLDCLVCAGPGGTTDSNAALRILCELFFHPSQTLQNRLVDMLAQVLPLLTSPTLASMGRDGGTSTLQSSFVQRLMARIILAVKCGVHQSPPDAEKPQFVNTPIKAAMAPVRLLCILLDCRCVGVLVLVGGSWHW